MNDKTGGPAFPHVRESMSTQLIESGMTLRDYFAVQALNGLMSANWDVCERRSAEIAYAYADCMLEAREKKP